jgi:rhamnose utilization protein RhaD (predicted bifunctional aldolase and dehydrogenase)
MSNKDHILQQLIAMSRALGEPENDYVIIGEGNTSGRIDDATFWVKASGSRLHRIDAEGFVEMTFDGVLGMLDGNDLSDDEVKHRLAAAKADPASPAWPSLETALHALALTLGGAEYVGHTHPTAVNVILCSQDVAEVIRGRLFPEEVTYCGRAPAFVPYADPGLPLARKVREALVRHLDDYGERPKVILIQNHGLIALGQTPTEVENITAMCVKTARVLVGTLALGGPHFMSAQEIERIHTRPDEELRQRKSVSTPKHTEAR